MYTLWVHIYVYIYIKIGNVVYILDQQDLLDVWGLTSPGSTGSTPKRRVPNIPTKTLTYSFGSL